MRAISDNEQVFETAKNFDISAVVKRYAKDHDVPMTVAEERAEELKKFLTICALYPGEEIGMAGCVDDVWHEFITYTHLYNDFCHAVAGRFLHHVPHDAPRPIGKDDGYMRFLELYEETFGNKAPAHIWPQIGTKGDVDGACYYECVTRCDKG